MINDLSYELNEISEDSLRLTFSVSNDSMAFEGHFDSFKLLPGLFQLEIVFQSAKKFFNLNCVKSNISSVKFLDVIKPNALTNLEMFKQDGVLVFKMSSEEKILSKGKLKYV